MTDLQKLALLISQMYCAFGFAVTHSLGRGMCLILAISWFAIFMFVGKNKQ